MTEPQALRQAAIDAIAAAFPVGVPPTAGEMQNDHCPECTETAARFVGKRWPDVSPSDLQWLAIPLLPVAGFRYYLPALMLHCLEAPEELDTVPDDLVSSLAPPGGKLHGSDAERLEGFTRGQLSTILLFLRWREACEKASWSKPGWPKEAVESIPTDKVLARALRYWGERATGAA